MKSILAILFAGCLLIGTLSFRTYHTKQPASLSVSLLSDAVVQPHRSVHILAKIDTVKLDAETGLANDPKLMMVKSQCLACHSSKLILQHRFTRAGWQERIRWMQKYHKLWELGESEKVVLDYLEKHYGPQTAANVQPRRAPLKDIKWYKLNTP